MKGDFTRLTFDREKHYSSVRWQQGRVHLDADWNEAMDILAHGDRTTRGDVIGPCGGPGGRDAGGRPLAGFLIDVDPAADGGLRISPGRYYVDGLLVENEAGVAILQQPDLPPLPGNRLADVLAPPGTQAIEGVYLAYLDVWERHIGVLEDPAIREVALGGPDTATRTKVIWQVKLLPAGEDPGELNCASELALWDTVTAPSSGRLAARAEPQETPADPCIVPARAGYRGLENQLYRVEVHRLVSPTKLTLKWSRENGSVAFAWLGQDSLDPNRLTVQSTGRDQVLGLGADHWVELTDTVRELRGQPGLLVRIQAIEGNVLVIDPGGASVDFQDFPVHPKVRRWDMEGEISVDLAAVDHWIELEQGIQVSFQAGTLRSGDYWLIPARTATRDIHWPRDEADDPAALPPQGIHHHYCRLALLRFDGQTWSRLRDCRCLFPPLSALLRFFPVGGDGQEALPGRPAPRPLEVGVANGQQPVAGARVRFRVVGGNGRLRAMGGNACATFTTGGAATLELTTGPDGVAACCWRLDGTTRSQQVEAVLLELDGKPFTDPDGQPRVTPLHFNANLSSADQVAYDPRQCPDLAEAQTVQEAIDRLCRRPQGGGCCVTVGKGGAFERLDEAVFTLLEQGQRDICICLLAGEHISVSPSIDLGLDEGPAPHLAIQGCGPASRLVLTEKPWLLQGLASVTLGDLAMEPAFQVDDPEGAIALRRCAQVTVKGCQLHGFTAKGPLLSIVAADQVRLRDNGLEASRFDSLELPQKLFEAAGVELLAGLFALPAQGDTRRAGFRERAVEAAGKLAATSRDERAVMGRRIGQALGDPGLGKAMSSGEVQSIGKLSAALAVQNPAPAPMLALLLDIRRAAIKTRPGLALVVGETRAPQVDPGVLDADGLICLESNHIAGIVSLYGLPADPELVAKALTPEVLNELRGQLKERRIRLDGRLGTFNLRGNQLVRITVAAQLLQAVLDALSNQDPVELSGLFGRCLCSDNLFEGGDNLVLGQSVALATNAFKLSALPVGATPVIAGTVIANSSLYTGNHARPESAASLRDAAPQSVQAANLEMTIG